MTVATAAAVAVGGLAWMTFGPSSAAPEAGAATTTATAAGATTAFTSYEAEDGTLAGGATKVAVTSAPTSKYSSAALEASGLAYAHLAATNQSVQWTNNTGKPVSYLNVRASIPDSSDGTGTTATLDLYVNGTFRQSLDLNSKQTWIYEGSTYNSSTDENPANGDPRVFWDESRTFVTGNPIAAGSTIQLKKSSTNTASYYDIDVIDVENPPAPIAQPDNSLSITSCGAVVSNVPTNGSAASGSVDSRAAIQTCINQAQTEKKILWIPQGTFYVKGTSGLTAKGITIAGAGQWYSNIYRDVPLPYTGGLSALFSVTSCTVQNFHIDSNSTSRHNGDGGAMDTTGTDWSASGLWSQHTMSGFWASGTGGTIQNNRLTSIWADGINVNNQALNTFTGSNLTVTNNYIRGTGDDELAINSVAFKASDPSQTYPPMSNVTMTHNTAIAPWGAHGIGIYGGGGHVISDNYLADSGRMMALNAGVFSDNGSDLTSATITDNVIVRSGGNSWGQGTPAVIIGDGAAGQNNGAISNVTMTGNTISDSLFDAIGFTNSTNSKLQNNTITNPGRNGIVIAPPFFPAPVGSATITSNTVSGLKSGMTAYQKNSSTFTATVTNNSWQGGSGATATTEAPFGGTAAALPGTVQAENYDTGGQGIGYSVSSVNGNGTAYRSDGVDIQTTTDTGGGYNLGFAASSQWFRYTVKPLAAGTYTLSLRVAAPSAVTGALHLSNASGTNLSGAVNIPATGGYQTFTDVTATVALPAGQQVLTLNEDKAGWNIDSLSFADKTASAVNSSTWYEVVNQSSGKCVDATGAGTANGTVVQQYTCVAAVANQEWQFASAGSGYSEVLNRNAAAQTQAWDVIGGAAATSGAKLQTWSYHAETNQQWQAVAKTGGTFTLVARNNGLCLTTPSTANGAQLQVSTCNGSTAQSFFLSPQAS
ncbi:RICIN domain-containing protein [Streptomyces sp. NPDC087263]|uniref:RICIN domain-containing protein n=1 Tax=Streptomyces sp. NPDC087263 TaxID=3365773 RepID=UPI0037F70DCC